MAWQGSSAVAPPQEAPAGSPSTSHTPVTDELDLYLRMPEERYEECNALEWWKEHAAQLPNLSRMARQYLAAPASSAAVERMFSRTGRYHSDQKKRTKGSTIETLLIAALCTR